MAEDFESDSGVLRADAAKWDQGAEELSGPIQAIAPLTLNGADDVMGLGSRLGIDTSYENARSRIELQMNQAVEYFGIMATALRDVATNYDQREAANAEGFRSTQGELGGN